MLKIYDPSDATNVIPLPLEDDRRFVTHKFDGHDTLTFEIASNSNLYKYIAEEVKIEDEKNRYVVKNIDEHSNFVVVTCDIDLDDWKRDIFREFRTTNETLLGVLQMMCPAGWTILGAGMFAKRTTVEEYEGKAFDAANAFEILPAVSKAYSCVFNFNVIEKTIEAIDPTTFSPSGDFFTDELNLRSIGFVGNSDGFATRLYAYGKKDEDGNPLTFESINDGKPYVEDYSYSDKIISIGWSDERYTVKESLLEAARAKLKEVSFPTRSYECDAKNLNDGAWMYKIVTLVDRRRSTRVEHQIVEYKEYPNHMLDSITLSAVAPKIESHVNNVTNNLGEMIQQNISSMQQFLQQTVDNATQQITGNKGGCFRWIFDAEGKPSELVNLGDTEDINTAQSVWRWNASGLGHSNDGYNGAYTLALLADGSINAEAITTGVMNANIIRAGKITDLQGKNYWDLETGEFRLSADAAVTDDGKTLEEIIGEFEDLDLELTQENVFNALTNNGQSQGIYLKNGYLYINAAYVATGILSDTSKNTTWDLSTGSLSSKKFSIQSDNFKLSERGELECTNAVLNNLTANGTFLTGDKTDDNSQYIEMSNGQIAGGYGNNQSGAIYFGRSYNQGDGTVTPWWEYQLTIHSDNDFWVTTNNDIVFLCDGDFLINDGIAIFPGITTFLNIGGYELQFVKGLLVGIR